MTNWFSRAWARGPNQAGYEALDPHYHLFLSSLRPVTCVSSLVLPCLLVAYYTFLRSSTSCCTVKPARPSQHIVTHMPTSMQVPTHLLPSTWARLLSSLCAHLCSCTLALMHGRWCLLIPVYAHVRVWAQLWPHTTTEACLCRCTHAFSYPSTCSTYTWENASTYTYPRDDTLHMSFCSYSDSAQRPSPWSIKISDYWLKLPALYALYLILPWLRGLFVHPRYINTILFIDYP